MNTGAGFCFHFSLPCPKAVLLFQEFRLTERFLPKAPTARSPMMRPQMRMGARKRRSRRKMKLTSMAMNRPLSRRSTVGQVKKCTRVPLVNSNNRHLPVIYSNTGLSGLRAGNTQTKFQKHRIIFSFFLMTP